MSINPNVRKKNRLSGSSKNIDSDQMVDLAGFAGLHMLGTIFAQDSTADTAKKRRGRRAGFPPLGLLAVLGCARVTGSLASTLAAFHDDPELWVRFAGAFEEASGVELPQIPPTRDQVIYFRDWLASNPEPMRRLQMRFSEVAVVQARAQGNLNPGVEPDWAAPLEAHSIYGDGTIIASYSEVRRVLDPVTGTTVFMGSRAASPHRARVQKVTSNTVEDGKDSRGLNMVSMHTWTTSGRVVLGTAVALGGEAWAALELADTVHRLAGDGVHSLIYDRAVTGWHVAYLMSACGIQVIGRAVGASAQQAAYEQNLDADLREVVSRRIAEYGAETNSDTDFLVRRSVLADMLSYHERMPLSLCIYPTAKRNFDLVRSWSRELDPVIHDGPGGPCSHRVAVDDGGLYEVEDHPVEEEQLVKIRVLRCETSNRYRRADGKWGRRDTYVIGCLHGAFEYVRTWEPTGTRYTPGSDPSERVAEDPVGWRLRPLSRADDIAAWYNTDGVDHFTAPRPFSDAYSRRNDAESYNQWYQASLPHHGRAASLEQGTQELDFLLGALLNNSITWCNRR